MEKVSVIIPCYNVEKYVEQCLQSLVRQTYRNLEIICINDGSTDSTLDLLKLYGQKDSRITVIDQRNVGLSATRNKGLGLASGKWIMFVDSDDWLETECIEETLIGNYDLVCFSYNRIFKNKNEPRTLNLNGVYSSNDILKRITGLTGSELADPTQANSLVTACAKIYRASIIKDNKIIFYDTKEIGTEDALFNMHYLNVCKGNVLIIDRPYYNYLRYNSYSLTTTYKPALFSQWKTLHHMMFEIIMNKSSDFHQAYYNRIALSIVGLGLNEMENPNGLSLQLKNLKNILHDPLYVKSFRKLNFKFFPLPWKFLFIMAKYRLTVGVYLMMKLISILWKGKNR